MSNQVNVDFVTRQIEVDTDGKEHFISAAMAAKDAETAAVNAQNAATHAEVQAESVKKYKALWFDSVAEMKAEPSLTAGAYVCTAGYYEPNDGGGASYIIREQLSSDVFELDVYAGNMLVKINNGLIAEEICHQNNYEPKYIACYFANNEWRQRLTHFSSLCQNAKKAGFCEIQMLIHINDDGSLVEDNTKFDNYNIIAREKNMKITSLKVHGNHTATNYLSVVKETLNHFPDVTTVFVFNEQFDKVYLNGLDMPNEIKANFPNITKIGITINYGSAFFPVVSNMDASYIKAIENAYDVLGIHIYPSCSSYTNKRPSYAQCLDAFNAFEFTIPWDKEIWITEAGVLPYWQFLEFPESYNANNLSDKNIAAEPCKLFFRALSNCNMAKKAKIIIPFYIESWHEKVPEMWTFARNIINKQGG